HSGPKHSRARHHQRHHGGCPAGEQGSIHTSRPFRSGEPESGCLLEGPSLGERQQMIERSAKNAVAGNHHGGWSTFCTSLHEILGICSLLVASLISLASSMRFSVANRPPPVASLIRSGSRPGPISGHSRFSAA